MGFVLFAAAALAAVVLVGLIWRAAGWPCPPWLVPLLENPYVNSVAGSDLVLDRAGVGPGMQVLDAGCGPGRLTIPAARAVGPEGKVVAMDVEPAMIEKLRDRLSSTGSLNVETVIGGVGEGRLPAGSFDVCLLVTVLGEIRDRHAALDEIHRSLKPGGTLSITEVIPDPHYQRITRVRALAAQVGFEVGELFRGPLSYTANFIKASA